ncbi:MULTISPECIES: lytic transglycosylase domain-containing protein [unclassified Nocardioides]|uniref:lytic transglycosylase domain-containing protein n=1 Tax=unclassified Nocardioides TaxID=2615069 RepID=UPI0009F0B1B6|nr:MULTISPECIES: lytic transglycosylase domain-containing protein [unclassified Nocardioides]GAW48191.1 Membrane-bound lytic murein transglycosylase B-like protein (Precursor) [Nocardioides sp. PD653-B2]GAW53447.1 Membrane-bound lytic murein transglycosylase B-l ike protein (Precursor) [Nocardioides sp. PD653]
MRTVRPARVAVTAGLALAALAVAASSPHPAAVPAALVTPVAAAPAPAVTGTTAPTGASVVNPLGVVSRSTTSPASDAGEIPSVALLAYQRAASVIGDVDRTCGLTWTVLAAVGRVESDHGRTGGAVLGDDGVSTPAIRGVALDGSGPVARVRDTDAGLVDGDRRWDRAVGPMQILPSTWSAVGVDGDGDGTRSADDIDDAALGAAVFLCAAPGDLTTRSGLRTAIHRYNPSDAYAEEVLAVERRYRAGDYDIPGAPADGAPAVSVRAVAALPSSSQPGIQDGTGEHHAPGVAHPHAEQVRQAPDHDGAGHLGTVDPVHPPEPVLDPPPSTDPEPDPTTPDPATPETRTGVLTDCGTIAEPAWCLDETALDVGDADYLAGTALGDFDGDGTFETNADELAGLVDTEITVDVTTTADEPPVLLAIGDLDYVAAERH